MRLYSSSGVIGFRDLGRLVDFWELLGAETEGLELVLRPATASAAGTTRHPCPGSGTIFGEEVGGKSGPGAQCRGLLPEFTAEGRPSCRSSGENDPFGWVVVPADAWATQHPRALDSGHGHDIPSGQEAQIMDPPHLGLSGNLCWMSPHYAAKRRRLSLASGQVDGHVSSEVPVLPLSLNSSGHISTSTSQVSGARACNMNKPELNTTGVYGHAAGQQEELNSTGSRRAQTLTHEAIPENHPFYEDCSNGVWIDGRHVTIDMLQGACKGLRLLYLFSGPSRPDGVDACFRNTGGG